MAVGVSVMAYTSFPINNIGVCRKIMYCHVQHVQFMSWLSAPFTYSIAYKLSLFHIVRSLYIRPNIYGKSFQKNIYGRLMHEWLSGLGVYTVPHDIVFPCSQPKALMWVSTILDWTQAVILIKVNEISEMFERENTSTTLDIYMKAMKPMMIDRRTVVSPIFNKGYVLSIKGGFSPPTNT